MKLFGFARPKKLKTRKHFLKKVQRNQDFPYGDVTNWTKLKL